MPNYLVLGYCTTTIPFHKEIVAEDEKVALREVKEFITTKAGVGGNQVFVDKIIELPDETPSNEN